LGLRLDDAWIWDSWIADDGEHYHLYFLQAPRALGDPGLRHTAAVIGHATSTDLRAWDYHGVALAPAAHGAWDDLALWTGSVVHDGERWLMYYTALNTAGGRGVKDQRLGLAASEDLFRWERIGEAPVLAPDRRLYRTLADGTASETWRDPFVFRDGDGWSMLITARDPDAPRLYDGVVAHARSADARTWVLQAPLSAPAGFGQIEVPQLRRVHGSPLLAFTCHPEEQSPEQVERFGEYCTWLIDGGPPWDMTRARPFTSEPRLFAAPLVQDRSGEWVFVGFRNQEPEGILSFEIIDPVPLR